MLKGLRLFGGVLFFSIFLIIVIGFLCHRLLRKSLPQTTGSANIEVLKNSVEVIRDDLSIPHIFAKNKYDLYLAAGFVSAQDRLWQMDFYRRIASGRLSEVFGKQTLEFDRHLRLLGFAKTAKEILETLSQESQLALTAYSYGINAYIKKHSDKLPVEFSILHYKPEYWRVLDSITLFQMLAWQSSKHKYLDLLYADLIESVESRKLRELFPQAARPKRYTIMQDSLSFLNLSKSFFQTQFELESWAQIDLALDGISWAVNGSKTNSGKPILVSAKTSKPTLPSQWYPVHLSDGYKQVSGFMIPGLPVFISGQNDSIAWAGNSTIADNVDFFIERIDSTAQTYFDGRTWQKLILTKEAILVKNQRPDTLRFYSTSNGPVISECFAYSEKEVQALVMRWTGFDPVDNIRTFLGIQESVNWPEFVAALDSHRVPVLGFTYSDSKNNIGYKVAGRVPVRQYSTGELPHNGWQRTGRWTTTVPKTRLPQTQNPSEGFLKHSGMMKSGSFYFANALADEIKNVRIDSAIYKAVSLTINDNAEILQNSKSRYAEETLPLLLQSLNQIPDSLQSDSLKMLTSLIKYWDYEESTESVAASIFQAFLVNASRNIFLDEMGQSAFNIFTKQSPTVYNAVKLLLNKERSEWFDNIHTDEVENKNEIISRSLLQAGSLLQKLSGEYISKWRWGDLHAATFRHQLGSSNFGRFLLNSEKIQGKGATTIFRSLYDFSTPFESRGVNAAVQIFDLQNTGYSFTIIAGGISGQPLSKHYKDQLELWQTGKSYISWTDKKVLRNKGFDVLTLTPN